VATSNANQVNTTDVGFHWYLSEYIRVSFDWQHAMFNNPISTAPGVLAAKTHNNQDLLWFRWQLYY
jgi:phosphate-selective porin OprO/OprP